MELFTPWPVHMDLGAKGQKQNQFFSPLQLITHFYIVSSPHESLDFILPEGLILRKMFNQKTKQWFHKLMELSIPPKYRYLISLNKLGTTEVTTLSGIINYYPREVILGVGIYMESRKLFVITLSTAITSGYVKIN